MLSYSIQYHMISKHIIEFHFKDNYLYAQIFRICSIYVLIFTCETIASLLEYEGTNLRNVGSIISCMGDIGLIIRISYIFKNLSAVRPLGLKNLFYCNYHINTRPREQGHGNKGILLGGALVLVYHVDCVESMVIISIFQSASGNNSGVFPLKVTVQFGQFFNLCNQDLVVINTFCKSTRIAKNNSLYSVHMLI